MFERNTEQYAGQTVAEEAMPGQGQETAPNARYQAEVREFLTVFPEMTGRNLPQEVWDLVRRGLSLTAAYVLYLRAQSPSAGRAPTGNQVPVGSGWQAPASTGSLRSASASGPVRDPFLQGWEED